MLYKFLGKAVTGDVAYLEQQGSPGNQSYYEKLESGREFITGKVSIALSHLHTTPISLLSLHMVFYFHVS